MFFVPSGHDLGSQSQSFLTLVPPKYSNEYKKSSRITFLKICFGMARILRIQTFEKTRADKSWGSVLQISAFREHGIDSFQNEWNGNLVCSTAGTWTIDRASSFSTQRMVFAMKRTWTIESFLFSIEGITTTKTIPIPIMLVFSYWAHARMMVLQVSCRAGLMPHKSMPKARPGECPSHSAALKYQIATLATNVLPMEYCHAPCCHVTIYVASNV